MKHVPPYVVRRFRVPGGRELDSIDFENFDDAILELDRIVVGLPLEATLTDGEGQEITKRVFNGAPPRMSLTD